MLEIELKRYIIDSVNHLLQAETDTFYSSESYQTVISIDILRSWQRLPILVIVTI